MATNQYERQSAKYITVELGIAHIGTGNGYTAVVPRGAQIVSIRADVSTAFNSATTTTLSLSDGTTTFISAEDAKTAGPVTVDVASKYFPDGGTLTISMAETGATATAGKACVSIGYTQVGNGCSIQE